MPRQSGINVENNFKNGLITEASGLNFPENACTETWDCEFEIDGSVRRRLGFEFETNHTTKDVQRSNAAITTYLWKNVSGNGDVTILVVQVGITLLFYRISADLPYSQGAVAASVNLTPVAGVPQSVAAAKEMQFCDGNGYLFVTNPSIDPHRVIFDTVTSTVQAFALPMYIRDFEGQTNDPFARDERPTSTLAALNPAHHYNLLNQGWTTSSLTTWDGLHTHLPSNADVMWRFRDSSNNLDFTAASLARVVAGNTHAPAGHYILDMAYSDRNAISGLAGLGNTHQPGLERPSTCAFFAGRFWVAGINKSGFNSKIYFSQLVENDSQYSYFFQINDPSSEDLFDLLPTDGGVINIQEAGTIIKLFAVPGGLGVFSDKGVWFITGSQGIGFVANDYSIQKVSDVPAISASSFVTVAGYPSWWNSQGIYLMAAEGPIPKIIPLTDEKIKDFFATIPISSKRRAKGIWHMTDNHIRWIYKTETTEQITELYEYDRVLNLNLQTGAFYPWTISDGPVKVNSIIISDLVSGTIGTDDVVAGPDDVVDLSGNDVIVFTSTGSETSPFDKYLVTYPDGLGSYRMTFADKINSDYVDWFSHDEITRSYDSYFVSGYKIRGHAIRKFQNTWMRIFSRLNDAEASYYVQSLWDFSKDGSTGRWSSKQIVNHDDTRYTNASKRLKIRGHGLVLQFKVSSVPGEPFDIIGWSTLDAANATP